VKASGDRRRRSQKEIAELEPIRTKLVVKGISWPIEIAELRKELYAKFEQLEQWSIAFGGLLERPMR
jgi:hypothetical protein